MTKNGLAVVGIGGNSLIKDQARLTVPDQYAVAKETCRHIADMIQQGWDVALSHGNGPQVGFILRRSEIAHRIEGMHEVPLDFCGADSQGALGYTLQQNLRNEFRRRQMSKAIAAIVTQVVVHGDDPAFDKPTKPIGSSMSEEEARQREETNGWTVAEDGDRGWRRVVPSPYPQRIVELDVVKKLLDAEVVTITVGGGGIPVIENEDGDLVGVEAVVDKDYASALLARKLNADLFLISTAVERVALNYGKPGQIWLEHLTAEEARRYYHEGHFAPGSMGPKIEAALYYIKYTGNRVIITDPENITRALRGETGTVIEP
ncbi:MAG: carbamate kinase [Anaerolineales bacterium]|nr:MAG: carbamate kinase [Anaerolineales bacterium]